MLPETSHIKVPGHRGWWYVIDTCDWKCEGGTAYLLEHETYGDEAACIIIDGGGNILLEDVWNGFLDLEEAEACDEIIHASTQPHQAPSQPLDH